MILRDRYEREAAALWARLGRLGAGMGRLEGLYARDADPRIARLVQSAAFAFAVADARLDDDGQALVRPLVAQALPESLRPRPSSTIMELGGQTGPSGPVQGASFAARSDAERLPFRVVWPAARSPLAIESAVLDRLDARRQVLRFALVGTSGVSLGEGLPDVVRLFVNLRPLGFALDLLRALRCGAPGRTLWLDGKGERLADRDLAGAVRWVQVDTDEAPVVSARTDRFRSGTLLRDLFAFGESFCFFDLHVGAVRERRAERVEVILPLGYVVEDASHFGPQSLRLFCAPATNEFVGAIDPVPDSPGEARLTVAGKPHAEILEVRSLWATSIRDARQRSELRSWEAPPTPHTFARDETYYVLEQRLGVDDGTELRMTCGRLDAFPAGPGGVVEGEVLASDGARTSSLGLGDVGSEEDGATNITRVTRPRRAILGQNHAWRLSAYARMPSGRLANAAHLTELLALHDTGDLADETVRVPRPGFLGISHSQEHALERGALAWGDLYTLDLDPTGCSDGVLWLLGELVHRALAERSEALRFARLVLRKAGAPLAEYGARQGTRLPFPLG